MGFICKFAHALDNYRIRIQSSMPANRSSSNPKTKLLLSWATLSSTLIFQLRTDNQSSLVWVNTCAFRFPHSVLENLSHLISPKNANWSSASQHVHIILAKVKTIGSCRLWWPSAPVFFIVNSVMMCYFSTWTDRERPPLALLYYYFAFTGS